ncbi:MAG: hypothetical protein U0746_06280 [Gemmataceae bacterium]
MMTCRGLTLVLALLTPALASADGGTLRLSQQCDGYRIALFTAPASPRAGVVDFSVLVQSADAGATLADVPVTVYAYPDCRLHDRIGGPATEAAATNKLFRAIQLNLPEPGRWHVEVTAGSARVETAIDVGPPLPPWLDLAVWIGWPAAVVALFAVHQCLVRRRRPQLRGPSHES